MTLGPDVGRHGRPNQWSLDLTGNTGALPFEDTPGVPHPYSASRNARLGDQLVVQAVRGEIDITDTMEIGWNGVNPLTLEIVAATAIRIPLVRTTALATIFVDEDLDLVAYPGHGVTLTLTVGNPVPTNEITVDYDLHATGFTERIEPPRRPGRIVRIPAR